MDQKVAYQEYFYINQTIKLKKCVTWLSYKTNELVAL